MNNIDFLQETQFPVSANTLAEMQVAYKQLESSIVGASGGNCVISGCEEQGTMRSDGYIVYNGELLQFRASPSKYGIGVLETIKKETVGATTYEVHRERWAECITKGDLFDFENRFGKINKHTVTEVFTDFTDFGGGITGQVSSAQMIYAMSNNVVTIYVQIKGMKGQVTLITQHPEIRIPSITSNGFRTRSHGESEKGHRVILSVTNPNRFHLIPKNLAEWPAEGDDLDISATFVINYRF